MSRHSKFILVLMCAIFASLNDAISQIKVLTFNPNSQIHCVLVSKDSSTYKFRDRLPNKVFKSPGWYSIHILKDTILYSLQMTAKLLRNTTIIYVDDIFTIAEVNEDFYDNERQYSRKYILSRQGIDPDKKYTMFYIENYDGGTFISAFFVIEGGNSKLLSP